MRNVIANKWVSVGDKDNSTDGNDHTAYSKMIVSVTGPLKLLILKAEEKLRQPYTVHSCYTVHI